MAKPVSKTLIGAFVLGALALICGGIVILGSGALFRDVTDVVMFFDGSVGGLQVGAPVTFRGVAVGEVNRIQIVYEPAKQEFRIPVAAKLYPDRVISLAVSPRPAKLKDLIDMWLRAQLHMQSFITGQLSIQLETEPMYFDVRLPAGAAVTLPTPTTHIAFLYVYEGAAAVGEDARPLPFCAAGLLTPGESVRIAAGEQGVRLLFLAGKPIGEPVVQYGPFVMNTVAEIEQAIADYQSGRLVVAD